MTDTDSCREIARRLAEARAAVAFTGAGISTESGIPDFRSPGGIWSRSQPVDFDDFLNDASARHEYWRQKSESHRDMTAAGPNPAHRALARWEGEGLLRGVVTQNIDGLHQDAGSESVLELHGTAREVACLDCGHRDQADPWVEEFNRTGNVPACPECGGRIKHATISFGQALPSTVLEEAFSWSHAADLFLALGSSLVVQPAASLPATAKQHGAALVIVNREETPLDPYADIVIHDSIGETLAQVQEHLDRIGSE